MELNRISSHLFWLATSALDLGAITFLWWGLRDRELMLDLFEMSGGQRMHPRYFQVGGVIEDIPPGWEQKCRDFIKQMPSRIDQYEAVLDHNEILLQRTRGVGERVGRSALLELGVTGPAAARGRATRSDLRKAAPYSSLRAVRLQGPGRHAWATTTTATGAHRRDARVAAASSSRRWTGCPRARTSPTTARWRCPPRHELATAMEALIHHFKLVTEGFRVPPGETYVAIESPRGELGCFVRGRRLREARARAHARPLASEPAVAAGHGEGTR